MQNNKTPEIRFKGFTDDWEQRKLGDIADVYDGIHQTPDYTDNGIMFLSVENINTLKSEKYISEEAFIRDYKVYPEKGDILMTRIGDVGTPNVVETTEKVAFYVSLALLKPINVDSYFLCNSILSPFFQNGLKERTLVTAIPQKINKDEIGKVGLYLPTLIDEQREIGAFFQRLNHLITLHQRKHDKLISFKKAMLEKMFPKENEKVPEIRFQGFTDDWEQRKLNNYLETSHEKNISGAFNKADVLSVSGDYGIVNQIEFQGRSFAGASVLNYGVVHTGDIVYTKSPLKTNPYGIIKTNRGKDGIVSTLYAIYHAKPNTDANFVECYFNLRSRLNHYLHPLVNKGAKNDMKVTADNALLGGVIFPKLKDEQKMISSLFSNLDNLITLHQRKENTTNYDLLT